LHNNITTNFVSLPSKLRPTAEVLHAKKKKYLENGVLVALKSACQYLRSMQKGLFWKKKFLVLLNSSFHFAGHSSPHLAIILKLIKTIKAILT
jgi:hypothetical protein